MIKHFLSTLRAAVSGHALVAAAADAHGLERGALVAAASAEGAPLQRIRVLPMGSFTLRDGRGPFTVADQAHAASIVAASLAYAGKRDIPFDYDHQLLHAVGPGKAGTAAASGWVRELTAEADGIYATVEWTPAAAQKLAAREYRYISPTFAFDKANGRVTAIRYGSLVNDNAIDELLAVASTSQENPVNLSKIAAALGLDAAASEDDILAAIGQMAMPKQTVAACATALGLAEAAAPADIIAAATAAAAKAVQFADPAQFVSAATHQAAVDRLAELEKARRDGLVAAATAEGKLPPAQIAWAQDLIAKDEASFITWAANQPVVVPPGEVPPGKVGGKTADELVAAATAYTAEQAAKGIIVTADVAVRHVLNQGK